jgi:hypothetical protein
MTGWVLYPSGAPLSRTENLARGFGTKKSEVSMAGKSPIAPILISDKATVAFSAEKAGRYGVSIRTGGTEGGA